MSQPADRDSLVASRGGRFDRANAVARLLIKYITIIYYMYIYIIYIYIYIHTHMLYYAI